MRSPSEAFGDYVVYEQLGLGGMATVHRAETKGIAGFSKQVALKRMLPSAAADAKLVKSFIREAQLASHLHHANVAQTYDLGKVGDVYFIAMELVPGHNLREILKHCATVAGNMPLPLAMNIVNQIADALDYAHNLCDESGQPLGIIHRDVSPSNVIVGEGGVVKLIDFGIAKARGSSMTTVAGTIKGKFSYLAPEALFGNVDARSDLFALGIIAYELLTNRPLFQGKDDIDTLNRVKDMPILPPSRKNTTVPPELDHIVMTALERDPEKRWQRATALHQALSTETKRLGLMATNQQVVEWIDAAFQQSHRDEDSEPSISISSHTMEMAQGSVPDDFLTASDSLATTVKPTGSKPFQKQEVDWKASSEVTTGDSIRPLETTQRDQVFEVPTVNDKPSANLDRTGDDWNEPSAAQTLGDRPSVRLEAVREVMDWQAPSVVETRVRPSAPHVIARPSTPQPLTRPTPQPLTRPTPPPTRTSEPVMVPQGPRTGPLAVPLPHVGAPLSGARTAQHLELGDSGAMTSVHAPPMHGPGVGAVLDDLEQRSSVSQRPGASAARTNVASGGGGASNFLLAVLVLIAAGGAAAVVYFALPYLT